MGKISFDREALRKGARQAALAFVIAGTINIVLVDSVVLVNSVTHKWNTDIMESAGLAMAGIVIYFLTCINFGESR